MGSNVNRQPDVSAWVGAIGHLYAVFVRELDWAVMAMQRGTLLLAVVVLLAGCGGAIYPITTGAGISTATLQPIRFVVWSNHAGAGHHLEGLFLHLGHTVVERNRLEQVFQEQKVRLRHSLDNEVDVLRVGRLVGATQVVFVDVHPQTDARWSAEAQPASVAVRGVAVESGEILWSGTTRYLQAARDPELAVLVLTHWAVYRAACPVAHGYIWKEPSSSSAGGCSQSGVAPDTSGVGQDNAIWSEIREHEAAQRLERQHAVMEDIHGGHREHGARQLAEGVRAEGIHHTLQVETAHALGSTLFLQFRGARIVAFSPSLAYPASYLSNLIGGYHEAF